MKCIVQIYFVTIDQIICLYTRIPRKKAIIIHYSWAYGFQAICKVMDKRLYIGKNRCKSMWCVHAILYQNTRSLSTFLRSLNSVSHSSRAKLSVRNSFRLLNTRTARSLSNSCTLYNPRWIYYLYIITSYFISSWVNCCRIFLFSIDSTSAGRVLLAAIIIILLPWKQIVANQYYAKRRITQFKLILFKALDQIKTELRCLSPLLCMIF